MTSDVFQGKIEGFAEISVDYFLGRSLHCSTFFLSHCHTDHIKGLDSQEFKSLLQQKQVKIYCTHITASLVLKRSKLKYLASSFIHLEKDESYTLHVSHDETVNVTLLDANHCPGSVMFLFSKDGCNALYTGDFRVNKYLAINDAIKDVQLNYLYIDTTFFSPKIPIFHNFPSREESEDAVVRFVLREKEKNDSLTQTTIERRRVISSGARYNFSPKLTPALATQANCHTTMIRPAEEAAVRRWNRCSSRHVHVN